MQTIERGLESNREREREKQREKQRERKREREGEGERVLGFFLSNIYVWDVKTFQGDVSFTHLKHMLLDKV